LFPGRPVPPWPAATPGEDFRPPTGRGLHRLVSGERTGRCSGSACGRAWPRRADRTLIAHAGRNGDRCEGSGQAAAEDLTVASWLSILRGVTPHGLRHGLQTWMDEDGIPEVLKTERMGHEIARWQIPKRRAMLLFPAPFGPTITVSRASRPSWKVSNDNTPLAPTEVTRMTRSLHRGHISVPHDPAMEVPSGQNLRLA
jgi:hypothetical protein